jgi:Outer membrane protein beta-barrel domain
MKKYFSLIIISSLFTMGVTAQKTTIGFNAGATLSSYKTKVDNVSSTSDSKTGLTAGVVVDIPMGKSLSFQPALQFTQKGGKESMDNYKFTTALNYMEIPLNVLFKTNSSKTRFFAGAGPSMAIGLSGKLKVEGDGQSDEADVKFGNGDEDDLKSLDFGANVLAGCQFRNGIFLSANYNTSLTNLFPGGSSDGTFKNHYFGLRIGYMLSNTKKHK